MRRTANVIGCAIVVVLSSLVAVGCSSGGDKPADAGPPDAVIVVDAMPPDAGTQAFGDPCAQHGDCGSGYCVEKAGGGGGVCSRECNNDCPTGWDCKSVTLGNGDMVNLCVPLTAILCARCSADDQCPGGDCLSIDGETRCASSCTVPADCPTGYTCAADAKSGHSGMFCQPNTNSCSCTTGMSGASRSCSNANVIGTCWGTETCDPATGWSACDARTPATEVCDGIDNDCNFVIDDGVGGGEACNITNGFGTCGGTRTCEGAQGFQCVGKTPAMELCNFLDDNCNGAVDESFPDLGTLCQAGTGACLRYGSMQCNGAGTATQCSAVAGTAATELCNGIDDNCNGATDEAFPSLGNGCSVGQGVCLRQGTVVCDGAQTGTMCSATPGPSNGAEVCNYLDDDCDGAIDNGFRDVNGTYNQATHCGTCSIDCTSIYAGAPNASGTCKVQGTNAQCALQCNVGTFDLNAATADGCEFVLDGGAIYVSTSDAAAADDGTCGIGPVGTGTGNHPCKSITFALTRAGNTGRNRLTVADGTYDEAVAMANGISMLGGYRADTWERHLATTATVIQGVSTSGAHDRTVIANNITSITLFEGFVVRGSANAKTGGNSYAVYVNGSNANLTIRSNQIFAGRGGPGSTGGSGTNGTAGNNGATYTTALDSFTTTNASGFCAASNNRAAAGAGARTCPGSDDVGGGNGGGNNCTPSRSSQTSTSTSVASAGQAGAGGGGGTAGAAGVRGYDALLQGSTCFLPINGGGQTLPMFGADGKDGGIGGSAGGVAGCAAATGSVVGGNWIGGAASTGAVGSNGGGGGGGAAGAGSACKLNDGVTNCADMLGGHGGGGGTGGCGGNGGTGGGPGGGAFAIFVVGTQAPVIASNTLSLGDGGDGGEGGIGGAGGLGGTGTQGGQTGTLFCTGKGGRGGDGGNGGAGSGGGGGCGGASVGIYTSGIGAPNYCTSAGNTLTGGVGGPAGPGGFSGGNSGGSGAVGVLSTCSFN